MPILLWLKTLKEETEVLPLQRKPVSQTAALDTIFYSEQLGSQRLHVSLWCLFVIL